MAFGLPKSLFFIHFLNNIFVRLAKPIDIDDRLSKLENRATIQHYEIKRILSDFLKYQEAGNMFGDNLIKLIFPKGTDDVTPAPEIDL